MFMEYKIPKTTLRAFVDLLKSLERNLANLEVLLSGKLQEISYSFLGASKDQDTSEYQRNYELFSKRIKGTRELENSIEGLIYNLSSEDSEDKKYIDNFDAIMACVGTNNVFFTMLVIDILRNNVSLGNFDKYNMEREKILVSCFDGYLLKEGARDLFISSYKEYLKSGHDYLEFINGTRVDKKIIDKQLHVVEASTLELPKMYEIYVKSNDYKKEYVSNKTKAYTKENKVHDYIDGTGVKKVLDPKVFDELLISNGYSDMARFSLNRQMIKAIEMLPSKEIDKLVLGRVKSLDIETSKKLEGLMEKENDGLEISLEAIYKYFLTISGMDIIIGSREYLGYGYSNDDLDFFLIEEIKSLEERYNIRRTSIKKELVL